MWDIYMCGRIRVKMGPQISKIRIMPVRNQVHNFEKKYLKSCVLLIVNFLSFKSSANVFEPVRFEKCSTGFCFLGFFFFLVRNNLKNNRDLDPWSAVWHVSQAVQRMTELVYITRNRKFCGIPVFKCTFCDIY